MSDTEPVRSVEVVVPVLEERVAIRKEVTDRRSGLRLRKVVHEEPAVIRTELASSSFSVTRTPVGRDVEAPVEIRYEGDIMIVPVLGERLVTRKQLVLLEEIRIRRATRTEPVSHEVSLRREQIIIERQDPATGEWRTVEAESNTAQSNHPAPTGPPT